MGVRFSRTIKKGNPIAAIRLKNFRSKIRYLFSRKGQATEKTSFVWSKYICQCHSDDSFTLFNHWNFEKNYGPRWLSYRGWSFVQCSCPTKNQPTSRHKKTRSSFIWKTIPKSECLESSKVLTEIPDLRVKIICPCIRKFCLDFDDPR